MGCAFTPVCLRIASTSGFISEQRFRDTNALASVGIDVLVASACEKILVSVCEGRVWFVAKLGRGRSRAGSTSNGAIEVTGRWYFGGFALPEAT